MNAIVVYESMFGNTQAVAEAIAKGLSLNMSVDLFEVGEAPAMLDGVDLLVAGAPTHAFGLPRVNTRATARSERRIPLVSESTSMREWLTIIEDDDARPLVAAFDTRINFPRLPGSAARKITKQLELAGFPLLTSPVSFHVTRNQGPLAKDELERAQTWGDFVGRATSSRLAFHSIR